MKAEAPCRLMLVEDDVGIGRLLERGLGGAGYEVEWVRDLASAVELARTKEHDLVVLDRMLPDGDGASLCAALRRIGRRAPICMLTARETLDDKLAGFDAGADDYITKPFEFDELLARLGVLRRWAAASGLDLRLEPKSRTIAVGTKRVQLTRREWPLLDHLLKNEARTFTRDELISEAWGDSGEVTANNVDVYVSYLRRKLRQIDAPLRIETVRGQGFRLVR